MTDHDHNRELAAFGVCRVCDGRAPEEAPKARDAAIYEAMLGAPAVWLLEARDAVLATAARLDEFTTDDVWPTLSQPPEPRALGAVLRDLAEQGEIIKTDRVRPSIRPECHANPKAIWHRRPQGPVDSVDDLGSAR